MNRELTQDECRDQRTLLKILERNKLAEWLGGEQYWLAVVRQLEAMQTTGTTDGEDLAELTDEDARERPWVMGDSGPWEGPHRLLSGPPITPQYCVIATGANGIIVRYSRVRRANQEELKKVGIYE